MQRDFRENEGNHGSGQREGGIMKYIDVLKEKLVKDSCPNEFFKGDEKLKKHIEEHCHVSISCRECWEKWLDKEVE